MTQVWIMDPAIEPPAYKRSRKSRRRPSFDTLHIFLQDKIKKSYWSYWLMTVCNQIVPYNQIARCYIELTTFARRVYLLLLYILNRDVSRNRFWWWYELDAVADLTADRWPCSSAPVRREPHRSDFLNTHNTPAVIFNLYSESEPIYVMVRGRLLAAATESTWTWSLCGGAATLAAGPDQ